MKNNNVIKIDAEMLIKENWKFVIGEEENHTPKRVRDLAMSDVSDWDAFVHTWKEEYNATDEDFNELKKYIQNMSDNEVLSLKTAF